MSDTTTNKVTVYVADDVELPPLDTSTPARKYGFLQAIKEWACYSPIMRAESNLDHMQELTDAVLECEFDGNKSFVLSEPCYQAAVTAFKFAMDQALDGKALPNAYAPKVLRHYHAFAKAKSQQVS